MTVSDLIARLQELPGDLNLRQVKFAHRISNTYGKPMWALYPIQQVTLEPMAVWIHDEREG